MSLPCLRLRSACWKLTYWPCTRGLRMDERVNCLRQLNRVRRGPLCVACMRPITRCTASCFPNSNARAQVIFDNGSDRISMSRGRAHTSALQRSTTYRRTHFQTHKSASNENLRDSQHRLITPVQHVFELDGARASGGPKPSSLYSCTTRHQKINTADKIQHL